MRPISIHNKYALVTGGSSGIGLAFIHQLAQKGYNVCIVSNEKETLSILENEIPKIYGVNCLTLYADLSQNDSAQSVHSFCKYHNLSIEVLINNAGFLIADNFLDVDPKRISDLLKLHVVTTTLMCHFFAPDMIIEGRGYILNVSSTSAYMSYPLISLYGPSKTYVRNFTHALRNELYSSNIHVSCILPGAVDTNLYNLSASKIKLAKNLGIMHSPSFIAKEGLRILFKNRGQKVPGILNQFSLIFLKLVPDFLIRKLLALKRKRDKD